MKKIGSLLGIVILILFPLHPVVNCTGSGISERELEIYNKVKFKLDERCELIIDTVAITFPEDLKFGERSRYVSYDTTKFPGYITIWYTSDIATEKESLTEDDFYMYLIPIEKAIGEDDELMGWAERKHEKERIMKNL